MCDKVLQIEVFLSSNISGLTIRCLCCAHRTNCQWGNSWNLRVSWERSTGILSNWLQLGCLLLGCCSKAAEDWTSDRWEWLGFPTPTFSPSPRVQGRGVWADLRRAALWAPSARDRTAWTWRVPTPTTSCSWSTKCGGLQMCCSTSRKLASDPLAPFFPFYLPSCSEVEITYSQAQVFNVFNSLTVACFPVSFGPHFLLFHLDSRDGLWCWHTQDMNVSGPFTEDAF